jgi:putative transposase
MNEGGFMPRTARVVVPNVAHHIVQRGNRRQDVFFTVEDYRMYLSLLNKATESGELAVHAYCLMRNHVHLIVTPAHEAALRHIGSAHRQYTRYINKQNDWRGHLWQERFSSFPMDEAYSYEAVRYVELNPVAAGICAHPADYRWSSARTRLGKPGDFSLSPLPVLAIDDWERYWQEGMARKQAMDEFLALGTP